MNNLKPITIALVFASLIFSFAPIQAFSQDSQALNIRVVDVESIRSQSKAFTTAREKIVAYGNKRSTELQNEDKALRDIGAELNRKRTLLSPEAFAEERKTFDARVATFQRTMQEHQQVVNNLQLEVLGKINNEIIKIIAEYAKQNNVTMILPSQSVVLSAESLNIDNFVLERLNKDLPSVPVTLPTK